MPSGCTGWSLTSNPSGVNLVLVSEVAYAKARTGMTPPCRGRRLAPVRTVSNQMHTGSGHWDTRLGPTRNSPCPDGAVQRRRDQPRLTRTRTGREQRSHIRRAYAHGSVFSGLAPLLRVRQPAASLGAECDLESGARTEDCADVADPLLYGAAADPEHARDGVVFQPSDMSRSICATRASGGGYSGAGMLSVVVVSSLVHGVACSQSFSNSAESTCSNVGE